MSIEENVATGRMVREYVGKASSVMTAQMGFLSVADDRYDLYEILMNAPESGLIKEGDFGLPPSVVGVKSVIKNINYVTDFGIHHGGVFNFQRTWDEFIEMGRPLTIRRTITDVSVDSE